jgi:5-methylcytosine-specific restriction endonuclease McrA
MCDADPEGLRVLSIPDTARRVLARRAPVRRVVADVTRNKKWTFDEADLAPDAQRSLINAIRDGQHPLHEAFVLQQLRQKLYGYMTQDVDSKRYNHTRFVRIDQVLAALCACDLLCFYCAKPVMVVYEFAREPRQWTVERTDNARGHTQDNFEIACLDCNLRRRTILQMRYVSTKSMATVTKLGDT